MKNIKFIVTLLCGVSVVILHSCSNDDVDLILPKAIVSFSDETYRVVESSTDVIRVPVGINTTNHNGGTVNVSITGGVLGEDFTLDRSSTEFTIDFPPNSTTEYFSIIPIDDNRLNQDVELEIVLSEPTGSLEVGLVSFLQIIFLDDEERLTSTISFDSNSYQVDESETLNISINFSNESTQGGTITVIAGGGTAIYGQDYLLEGANEDRELTINLEEYADEASFNIIAIDNDVVEGLKTFSVQLLEVSGGITIDSPNSIATITIIEND